MRLQQFAQMRALENAYTSTNQGFVDHLLNEDERTGGKLRQELKLKRIQFDAVEFLAEDLDKVCGLLDISKRQFLEGALAEALERVKASYFGTLDQLAKSEGMPQLSLEAVQED